MWLCSSIADIMDFVFFLADRLFDWRPDPLRGERFKHEATVVFRNVFSPKEFETAMEKILDHKEGIRNQCSNFGKIKRLELYDVSQEQSQI